MYVDDGDTVRKDVQWGDVSRTVRVRDAHASWVVPDAVPDVSAVVSDLADASVRASADGDVDESVVERLEELGYA